MNGCIDAGYIYQKDELILFFYKIEILWQIVTAAPPADECKNRFIEYTFAKRHQCQIDYIAELSKAKGLEELWNQFQPKFQQNIENWKACAETGIMDRFEYVQTGLAV